MKIQISGQEPFVVGIAGFGDKTSHDGYGDVVLIERDLDGDMCVYIWADINKEDYTHKISLEGALESKREEE